MLLLGLVPVIALVLCGAALTVATIGGKLNYDYVEAYDKPSTTVTIAANVEVLVSPSDDNKVHVRMSGTYTDHEPTVDAQKNVEQGELKISAQCVGGGCRLELDVELPNAVQLSVETSGASVELQRLTGPVRVKTADGSINAVRLRSDTVSVTTLGGTVDLGFDRPPADVKADASDGSVHVQLPRTAAYAIDAAAAHGSTTLNAENDLGSKYRLRLRAANGSITVDAN
jgi:DUF4097 and DUF4098 domain-containing protein YvlB